MQKGGESPAESMRMTCPAARTATPSSSSVRAMSGLAFPIAFRAAAMMSTAWAHPTICFIGGADCIGVLM